MPGSLAWRALLVASLVLWSGSAAAHQTSVVYLDVDVRGRVVDVEVRVAADDLGEPVGLSPLVVPSRAQAARGAERAGRYVLAGIHAHNGGAPCEAILGPTALRDRGESYALALGLRYTCARQIDDLVLDYQLFFDLDPRHQGLAEIHAFGRTQEHPFRASDRSVRITGTPSRAAQFGDYVSLGIEHIFTGYDHIAFLVSLLLIAGARGVRGGLRYALGVVTAFTLAHSITLSVAAFGVVHLPSRLVESAIAVSIAYVALENVLRPDPRGRWLLTFAFGLVHGFGFASVLGELGVPRQGLALCLVGFNLGVELGQFLVVCVAFPFLLLLHRSPWRAREAGGALGLILVALLAFTRFDLPRNTVLVVIVGGAAALFASSRRWGYDRGVRIAGSCVIAALALLWLVERVGGHLLAGGVLG